METELSDLGCRYSSYRSSSYDESMKQSDFGALPASVEAILRTPTSHSIDIALPETLNGKEAGDSQDRSTSLSELSVEEAEILKAQISLPNHLAKTNYWHLYRYATMNDLVIMFISGICSLASGATLPLMTVIFGQLSGVFQRYSSGTLLPGDFNRVLALNVLYFVYLAIAQFITIYISLVGFIYAGDHITGTIKAQYLKACMRQNIAFFDELGAGEISTHITVHSNLIQDGISEKVGLTLSAVAAFIAAFVIGFLNYWKLTLILSSSIVAIALIMAFGSRFILKYTKLSIDAYANGGTIVEEVLSSIRTVTAFGAQQNFAEKYRNSLIKSRHWGLRARVAFSFTIGGIFFVTYMSYGLAFWQGGRFLLDGETNLGNILTVLLSMMIGAFSLGNVAPYLQSFTMAAVAATKIYNAIDRTSPIDVFSEDGHTLKHVHGTFEFRKIKHAYPSRPGVIVLKDFSLTIPAGKKTAIVGPSGSGKSTIFGLIERFYNPVRGQILLDGYDISAMNVRWLRRQISAVSQEPSLFATTIFENIRYGLTGTNYGNKSKDETRQLVIEAARIANAHDFVTNLPESYETNVGQFGHLLSGGQKQRIAIARAIVSNPKILLLDEATSALDTESERIVQAALESAAVGRTTIVIAHRLSTIKDADNIVVMTGGNIVEQGTHNMLLGMRGAYSRLVEAQKISDEEDQETWGGDSGRSQLPTLTSNSEEEKLINTSLENDLDSVGRTGSGVDMDELTRRTSEEPLRGSKPVEGQTKDKSPSTYALWKLIKFIGSFNRQEWKLLVVGVFFSIICGAGNPTQAVFFAIQILVLSIPVSLYTWEYIMYSINFWSLMYLMLAFVQLLAFVVQGITFALCSERLIHRLRDHAFRNILRQDITFFDATPIGALISFLSTETIQMAGLSGTTLGTILTMVTTMVAAIALSVAIGWKLALVTASMIPILILCGYVRIRILAQFQARAKKAYDSTTTFACEAIASIRTVALLTREQAILQKYQIALERQLSESLRSILRSTILFAASQSIVFLCIALGSWYGGTLIVSGEYNMFQFFVCFPAILFGTQSAGSVLQFAPDISKAQQAAGHLKGLFDRKPTIDSWDKAGGRVVSVDGILEFRDVSFQYPTRPDQHILKGLNLVVKPGQHVALVGVSGCGKSTIIALIERYYDPLAGSIYLDGKNISTLNVNDYRSFIALVGQEPSLYQGTIRDNILLGSSKIDEEILDSTIIRVSKEANIYDFVTSLPDGFNTVIGSKGVMLSGGQKQRIAIARALLRDPKILLLDEATSALDSESEHVVQAALDAAAKGRTTIAIAHRLSTIQNADVIYVLDQGHIIEYGTHSQLMRRAGRYSELVCLQNLSTTETY